MPDVYATAHGPLARLASPLAARARARRHERFFALTRLAAGGARAGRRLRQRSACAHSSPSSTSPASTCSSARLSRARSCARTPPRGCRSPTRVRPRVLLERDRARAAGAPRGVRRRAAARGARLVRADPRALVPDRAALAAAGRALAARRALRRPYWRLGATGELGGDLAAAAAAELEALFGPARPERIGPLVKSWVCVSPPGG